MSVSTFQKLALLTCGVLCAALLLPKVLQSGGKRESANSDGPPGHFPPMLHRKAAPEARGQFSRAHNPEAIARAKGGTAAGGKSNLAGQIIPVYGFGILLYILYIIFKITSKGKTTKAQEGRFSALKSANMKRKITDFELAQLQERLKETEEVMESMVSRAHAQCHSPKRVAPVFVDQEEALLLQLKEITRVMQEGRLVDGIPPERETVEPVYGQDLADYSNGMDYAEETLNDWDDQQLAMNKDGCAERCGHRREDGDAVHCSRDDPDRSRDYDFSGDCVWNEGEEVITGDEKEELCGEMMMKSLEVLSADERTETLHQTLKQNEDHSQSGSLQHTALIRRKTKKQ